MVEKKKKIIVFFCDGQKDLRNTFDQFKEKNKDQQIDDVRFTITNDNLLIFMNLNDHTLASVGYYDDYFITDKAMLSNNQKFIQHRKENKMEKKTSLNM